MTEAPRRKRTWLIAVWLLIAASLMMSATSLLVGRSQREKELEALENRIDRLESELSDLSKQLKSKKTRQP